MTDARSIARPYAKAAFEYAQAARAISVWSAALDTIAQAVKETDIQNALKNPAVSSQKIAQLLLSVVDAPKGFENFLDLLAENNRLAVFPDIADFFQERIAQLEGYLQLSVTTAYQTNDEEKATLEKKLTTKFKSPVKLTFHHDKALIGGMIIRSDRWVLDDSIRGRIARLQSVFN